MRIICKADKTFIVHDDILNVKTPIKTLEGLFVLWDERGGQPMALQAGLAEIKKHKHNCIVLGDLNKSLMWTEKYEGA